MKMAAKHMVHQKPGSKKQADSWCVSDEHHLFESYEDFNEWIDSDEGFDVRSKYDLTGVASSSKALYAGDRTAYTQEFQVYLEERYNELLSHDFLCDLCNSEHWYERNRKRFDQLLDNLLNGQVVPFIGAGISVAAGFPTRNGHLKGQGRTAGINSEVINDLLKNGRYEDVVDKIEKIRGKDTFVQEVRDAFTRTPKLNDTILHLTELFTNTVITTNYDRTIEVSFDNGSMKVQVVNPIDVSDKRAVDRVTIVKLHGSIERPSTYILGKKQYDQAYGSIKLDLGLPIPKLLSYYYRNSSLLFLGCSLYNDRTLHVFKSIKDKMGDVDRLQHFSIEQAPESEEELSNRNSYLLDTFGITPIWFPKGQYEKVENILRHLRNEVRYRSHFNHLADAPNFPIEGPIGKRSILSIVGLFLTDIVSTRIFLRKNQFKTHE